MPATVNTAVRNVVADAWADLWNSGKILIYDGVTLLATVSLAATAFGDAASGSVTLLGVPLEAIAGDGGIADNATLSSSDDTHQITGLTVGEADAHVILDNTDVNSGQVVRITAMTYAAASQLADPS